eukprot:6198035-Pleurochrysis_carterae.AAC.1
MQRAVAVTTITRQTGVYGAKAQSGRCSNEKAIYSQAHGYTVRERQRALFIRMMPCASGYQLNTRMNSTKMHGCICQNKQMRMHSDQSKNLQSRSDPRDRSSKVSIGRLARLRKFSVLPMKIALTLYCRCN